MINKYTCTSKNTTLILTYEYGELKKIESSQLQPPHLGWIVKNNLFEEKNLKTSDKIKVETIKVSFEDFWKKYDYKKDKQNALTQWAKLSEIDQKMAYNGIQKFKKNNGNYGQPALPYAERYLKYKRWEDED